MYFTTENHPLDSSCCLVESQVRTDCLLTRHDKTAVMRSVETTASQVVGNDHVSDGIKDKLNVVSVGRTRLVAVDLLRCALVLCFKLCLDVRRCFLVALFTYNMSSLSPAVMSPPYHHCHKLLI